MLQFHGARQLARVVFAAVLVLAGMQVSSSTGHASLSLSVTPGLIDLEATPGATGSQEIVVSNAGTDAFAVTIVVEPVASAPLDRSAVEWLAPSLHDIALEPGQQQAVSVAIAVPDNVASGGYYAKVTFTTNAGEAAANSAALAGQLGVGFMLTVDGDEQIAREAAITRFGPVLEADGRVGFRMQVANQGNVHLIAPSGQVVLVNPDGSAFGSLDFPETQPLLPGAELVMSAQGSLPLSPGNIYHADGHFTYQDGSDGGASIVASTEFSVSAALSLAAVTVCENLDRGPTLAIAVQNDGELGLTPFITLALESDTAGALGGTAVGDGTLLWPGDQQQFAADFPERLASGVYQLVTTVQYAPTAEPLVQVTSFEIGGLSGNAVPLCTTPATTPAAG